MDTLCQVRRTPFWRHFILKTRSFCQDRLGTNIGKALKTEAFSSQVPPEAEDAQPDPEDIRWAVDLHIGLGGSSAGDQREIFEQLVADVARRYYDRTIERAGLESPRLNAKGLHRGFGDVMAGMEDMVEFVAQMLGPALQGIILMSPEAAAEGDAEEDAVVSELERVFCTYSGEYILETAETSAIRVS
jgi:hypothetical protein